MLLHACGFLWGPGKLWGVSHLAAWSVGIGLTWVFDTGGLPDEVNLTFDLFAAILPEVPLTVTDPLGARAVILTAEAPSTNWKNRLISTMSRPMNRMEWDDVLSTPGRYPSSSTGR